MADYCIIKFQFIVFQNYKTKLKYNNQIKDYRIDPYLLSPLFNWLIVDDTEKDTERKEAKKR